MIDDPLMFDAEAAGDLARIYETAPALRARLTSQEFAYTVSEGLPIAAGEADTLITA